MIEIKTQLSLDDYIKLNYHLLYRKWAIKGMAIIGFFLIAISILSLFVGQFSWFVLMLGLYFSVGLRIQTYYAAKKNYNSNGRISETITYKFDKEHIEITGESFNSKLAWNKFYSVTENKDWILIWQSRQVANAIPKRDFQNGELLTFKEIMNMQDGLRNKLKK